MQNPGYASHYNGLYAIGYGTFRSWDIPTIILHTLLTNVVLLGAINEDVATA